jgi:hypothetical protein
LAWSSTGLGSLACDQWSRSKGNFPIEAIAAKLEIV